jgi:hypothetical protein
MAAAAVAAKVEEAVMVRAAGGKVVAARAEAEAEMEAARARAEAARAEAGMVAAARAAVAKEGVPSKLRLFLRGR